MQISIAMATYNGANHVQRQLDSFVSQTRMPDELVVCDDRSSDATLHVLEQFRLKAPFDVRIYLNDVNLGFTKNFEKALTKCTGDVIFLSDQDDSWYPDKIAVVTQSFFDLPEKLLVIHDGKLVDEQLISHGATKQKQVAAAYGSSNSIVTGALTAVRKELLAVALPVPDGLEGHDIWLHNIAGLLNARCVIDKELQLIVRHGSNTSGWIGSSVEKINKWDLWKSEWRTNPALNYQDRILINTASRARLEKIDVCEFYHFGDIVGLSMKHLWREREALRYREALVNESWFRQKLMILRMLAKGDYQYFNGWRSFLRDMVR